MSQQMKLEKVLDLLINEETDRAAELLHEIIVEKARAVYEEVVADEEEAEEEMEESISIEENLGGDETVDFTDEIEQDKEEVESDELNNGEAEEEQEEEEVEGEIEDRVEDLEAQLLTLRAEFDRLMADELEEPYHQDLAAEIEAEDEFAREGVMEETQFADKVADTGQSKEGKLTGTGDKSKIGATNTQSQFTKAPSKKDFGGKPTDFTKGGNEEGKSADKGKDETLSDNVAVDAKKAKATNQETGEGKFVGTGKNTPGAGKVDTKSPMKPVSQ